MKGTFEGKRYDTETAMKEFEAKRKALDLAGIESEPRMYSFSDFCLDNEVLSKEATDDLRHLRAMWDVYGDYYIAFCETNELEYEVIV